MKKVIFLIAVAVLLGGGLQAAQDSSGQQVAEVLTDAYAAESILLVRVLAPIKLDELVTVETRDRRSREVHEVQHVFGSYLTLKSPLEGEYLSGSRIFQ